jgi:hypothetical protein
MDKYTLSKRIAYEILVGKPCGKLIGSINIYALWLASVAVNFLKIFLSPLLQIGAPNSLRTTLLLISFYSFFLISLYYSCYSCLSGSEDDQTTQLPAYTTN